MAWCHQATSHNQNQCWPKFIMPHDITRPQRVDLGDTIVSCADRSPCRCYNAVQSISNTSIFPQNNHNGRYIAHTFGRDTGCLWVQSLICVLPLLRPCCMQYLHYLGQCFKSFWNSLYRPVAWAFAVKLCSGECHRTSLIRSQYWFKEWLGAVRQQAITWANVDLDLSHHMATVI